MFCKSSQHEISGISKWGQKIVIKTINVLRHFGRKGNTLYMNEDISSCEVVNSHLQNTLIWSFYHVSCIFQIHRMVKDIEIYVFHIMFSISSICSILLSCLWQRNRIQSLVTQYVHSLGKEQLYKPTSWKKKVYN